MQFTIPADVPRDKESVYCQRIETATRGSGKLFLFAGDQKVEHLNDDFYGPGIAEDDAHPEHLFRIASSARIGAFATQLGLISAFGRDYPRIPYVVKLNGKTHLVSKEQKDPLSLAWYSVQDVVNFQKESGLTVVGVGYTLYIGSEYETQMMREAASMCHAAHQHGLLAIIWAYPRGKAVPDERSPKVIAGAAGVAAALGADFAKINEPRVDGKAAPKMLKIAAQAAGRTKIICAGGAHTDAKEYLRTLSDQLTKGASQGTALGRNIHQRPLKDAIAFCNAVYALVVEGKSVYDASSLL
jgi:DhnA family fructose-bisphosphate aldolase class Ia